MTESPMNLDFKSVQRSHVKKRHPKLRCYDLKSTVSFSYKLISRTIRTRKTQQSSLSHLKNINFSIRNKMIEERSKLVSDETFLKELSNVAEMF